MINAPPEPKSDAERVALLLDACKTARDFIEYYSAPSSVTNFVAKTLRRAIEACNDPSG